SIITHNTTIFSWAVRFSTEHSRPLFYFLVSFGSASRSPTTATVTVAPVWPAGMATSPDAVADRPPVIFAVVDPALGAFSSKRSTLPAPVPERSSPPVCHWTDFRQLQELVNRLANTCHARNYWLSNSIYLRCPVLSLRVQCSSDEFTLQDSHSQAYA